MPVAEDFYKTDPKAINRIFAKLPSHIHKEQKIPTVEQQKDIKKFLLYNGLWLVLTYGADLLSLVTPWLGKGFKHLVKWKFKGNWKQKEVGI